LGCWEDFHFKRWLDAPVDETVWTTTTDADDPTAPHFGEAPRAFTNVIDTRQSYLQDVVAQACGDGHGKRPRTQFTFVRDCGVDTALRCGTATSSILRTPRNRMK
jgi:hypothetical protein